MIYRTPSRGFYRWINYHVLLYYYTLGYALAAFLYYLKSCSLNGLTHIEQWSYTQMKQDLSLGLSYASACFFHATKSSLDSNEPLPSADAEVPDKWDCVGLISAEWPCNRYLFWTYLKRSWTVGRSGSCCRNVFSWWPLAALGRSHGQTLQRQPGWWTSVTLRSLFCPDRGTAHHQILLCLCYCQQYHPRPIGHDTEKRRWQLTSILSAPTGCLSYSIHSNIQSLEVGKPRDICLKKIVQNCECPRRVETVVGEKSLYD